MDFPRNDLRPAAAASPRRRFLSAPWLLAASLAGSVLLAAVPAVQAQEVELRLITGFPLDGKVGDKMHPAKLFIERFNARAKGQARIRVIGGPEVVAPFDQLKALQTGQFDAMISTQAYFNEMKGLQFINFLTSEEQVKAMTMRGHETLQKISREGAGVTFVALASHGNPFYLWTREAKPIASVADFKGLKLRGLPGVNEQLVRFLGVVPTNLPSNDVYGALRGGMLDGALRDMLSIEVLNEGEYAKNRTAVRLADFSSEVYITNKAWDALPAPVRQIANEVAREAEKDGLEWMRQRVQGTEKLLADKYRVKVVNGTPELNDILGRRIAGAMIRQTVQGSRHANELVERFGLAPYMKD